MPDLVPVDHDPFSTFVPVDHDPFAVNPDAALAASMTHYAPDPVAEDIGRRTRQVGQNLWNTWTAPYRIAENLGRQTREGTLDPTNPETAGGGLELAAAIAGGRMPFARTGELGTSGGKIAAFHGSPHDFDKFDLSKIGTGEGAQAYGRGLYFAENEGVARDYRDTFNFQAARQGRAQNATEVANELLKDGPLKIGNRSYGAAAHDKLNLAQDIEDKIVTADLLPKWAQDKLGIVPSAKMYQVSINADPEHFLDWDKPLSEQHPKVQEAFNKAVGPPIVDSQPGGLHKVYGPGMRDQNPIGSVREQGGKFTTFTDWGQKEFPSLKEAVNHINNEYGSPPMSLVTKSPEFSEKLRAAGIPGIKYLDQQSRAPVGRTEFASLTPAENDIVNRIGYGRAPDVTFAEEQANPAAAWEKNLRHWQSLEPSGERRTVIDKLIKNKDFIPVDLTPQNQTRNFVVFDDKLIDILKKYGLAGLMAGGAYHFRTQQVDHDPFERQ